MVNIIRFWEIRVKSTVDNDVTRVISKNMYFFLLGFTPCKANEPQYGMELEEKEAQKD